MVWLQFALSAALLVGAAIKLADYGDVIAERTRLGGMLIGALLLASATSLPEFLTTINAVRQGIVDLAVGNLFGSNMFNMFLLALLDLLFWQTRILRKVAMKHALTAGLAILLTAMGVFFTLVNIDLRLGWVGVDSLLLMGAYILGVHLLRGNSAPVPPSADTARVDPKMPSLLHAGLGFAAAATVLIVATPLLVSSSAAIAETTGLGTGFVGTALVAMVTSLPELATVIAAVRIGAFDLAAGNLFGSNMFNMFILGATDLFYLPGRFFATIHPDLALVGLLALMLTGLALIGNLVRADHRRRLFVELDALLIIVGYGLGMYLLYSRGIGP